MIGEKKKCWDLMQCGNISCAEKRNGKIPCWRHAEECGDYQAMLNICRDCVVFLLNSGSNTLTPHEIRLIMSRREKTL